jgi:DegV family protein with EDD domain
MAVQILTDSTSYIDKETRDKLGINVISLSVNFEDESFREMDIDNETFYKKMKIKGIPKSSQPPVSEIYDVMRKAVEKGNSLFCVFISSDMSGTFSTAHIAKNMIFEEFRDAEIEIVDSRSNCMQLGYAAIVAARAAQEGKGLSEVKMAAEDNIRKSRFLFVPDSLEYLKKGGRIGGASALIGNLLKIIPILTVKNGVTTMVTKVRTKQKAVAAIVEMMLCDMADFGIGEITVHNIDCYDEAKRLADEIMAKLNIEVSVCDIGPVIGLHVGPGAIGLAYYTKNKIII